MARQDDFPPPGWCLPGMFTGALWEDSFLSAKSGCIGEDWNISKGPGFLTPYDSTRFSTRRRLKTWVLKVAAHWGEAPIPEYKNENGYVHRKLYVEALLPECWKWQQHWELRTSRGLDLAIALQSAESGSPAIKMSYIITFAESHSIHRSKVIYPFLKFS